MCRFYLNYYSVFDLNFDISTYIVFGNVKALTRLQGCACFFEPLLVIWICKIKISKSCAG